MAGGPQPQLSRLLAGCRIEHLDKARARSAGTACAFAGTSDIIDAAVVVGAAARNDLVITSDPTDLEHLRDVVTTHHMWKRRVRVAPPRPVATQPVHTDKAARVRPRNRPSRQHVQAFSIDTRVLRMVVHGCHSVTQYLRWPYPPARCNHLIMPGSASFGPAQSGNW